MGTVAILEKGMARLETEEGNPHEKSSQIHPLMTNAYLQRGSHALGPG